MNSYELVELAYIKALLTKVLEGKVENLVEAKKAKEVVDDLIIYKKKAFQDCNPSRQ